MGWVLREYSEEQFPDGDPPTSGGGSDPGNRGISESFSMTSFNFGNGDDDELTLQYPGWRRTRDRDTISQMSIDSREPVFIAAGDIRRRLSESIKDPKSKTFQRDPEDPSASVLKDKVRRI